MFVSSFSTIFKIYVDDIIIFFKTATKHAVHLRSVFDMSRNNNIFIKFNKTFLKYFFVQLLDQKIDFFEFFISEKKLRVIVKLFFFRNFRLLKTYLDMIDWLREYISFYVDIFKSLQKRKTKLLKLFFRIDNIRKTFSARTRLNNSTFLKLKFFRLFQSLLFKSFYLIHHDFKRQLFIDFDVNKEFESKIMMYHIKFDSNWNEKKNFSRKSLKSIFFFSKLLNSVEIRYWSTELKLVDIVWMLKKIRYLIKFSVIIIVIYIDHDAIFDLIKQITFITSFIDKFNLRLIRVFDYI